MSRLYAAGEVAGTGEMVAVVAPAVTEARVIVCVGPGGVGKTTTAAALALAGARSGLRACVVTIDPARRLADALGIGARGAGGACDAGGTAGTDEVAGIVGAAGNEGVSGSADALGASDAVDATGAVEGATNATARLGNDPHRVDPPPGEAPWLGQLWAVMLDAQSTFDHLVGRYATNPAQAQAILANPVYRNISAALSGTQEYMAVEKLYELQESGDFDLIVVDTPPAQHALDFMEAPEHLARLLDNRIFRLLMTPTRVGLRAIEIGAQLMLRTIAKVAGGKVVTDTVQFFTQFEGMEDGFRARAARADELLHSACTSFILVCSPRRDTVDEALRLSSQLVAAGLQVGTVVVNRCYPRYGPLHPMAAEALASTNLSTLVTNLGQLCTVAGKEEEQLSRVSAALPGAVVRRVPYLAREVCDVEALSEIVPYLVAEPNGEGQLAGGGSAVGRPPFANPNG